MILLLIIETMVITKLYIILIFAHTGMVMKKGILWACKNCNHWNLLLIWAYWIYEHWAWISMLPLYRRYDIPSFYSHCSYRNHILLLGFGNIGSSITFAHLRSNSCAIGGIQWIKSYAIIRESHQCPSTGERLQND